MPAFLAKLAQLIGPIFLNWLWGKAQAWLEALKAKKKIEADHKADREKNEKAQTPEERNDAAKDIIKNA